MAVLSCLTDLHSIPLVMAGFGTAWREVSMPEFFELTSIYNYTVYNSGMEPNKTHSGKKTDPVEPEIRYDLFNKPYYSLDSLDSSFGPDGAIYSVATKVMSEENDFDSHVRHRCELAVISPEILLSTQSVEMVDNGGGTVTPFVPYFPPQIFPVFNMYGELSVETNLLYPSISRQYNYILLSFGCVNTHSGVIFQNGAQDPSPLTVTPEEVWLPEFGTNTENFEGSGPIQWGGLYALLSEGGAGIVRRVGRDDNLRVGTENSQAQFHTEFSPDGYKFHWRAVAHSPVGGRAIILGGMSKSGGQDRGARFRILE